MSEPLTDKEIAELRRYYVKGYEEGNSIRKDGLALLATIAAREQTIKGMQEAFVRDTATIEELTAEVAARDERIAELEAEQRFVDESGHTLAEFLKQRDDLADVLKRADEVMEAQDERIQKLEALLRELRYGHRLTKQQATRLDALLPPLSERPEPNG